jgi:hypothetical protein
MSPAIDQDAALDRARLAFQAWEATIRSGDREREALARRELAAACASCALAAVALARTAGAPARDQQRGRVRPGITARVGIVSPLSEGGRRKP